jgi:hypothetical protein
VPARRPERDGRVPTPGIAPVGHGSTRRRLHWRSHRESGGRCGRNASGAEISPHAEGNSPPGCGPNRPVGSPRDRVPFTRAGGDARATRRDAVA